jgi:sugar lactone lactonase YvrE
MKTYDATIIREGLAYGEGPRWHDGRLWYSDFYRHGVFSMEGDGSDERLEVEVPGQPSGLGWTPDGDLLCVSGVDQRILRVHDGVATTFCDISEYCEFWANEMVVSSTGHCYVGSFGFDLDQTLLDIGVEGLLASPPPTTNLVVVSPQGEVIQSIPDIAFPNGSLISPDGTTLFVNETLAYRISAFTINDDGTLRDRRVWAQLEFVATDGSCLDADGEIWVANAIAPQCLRVKEGGEVTGVVNTTQNAFACMLGGEDRRTLYVMTAPNSSRFEIADVRLAKIESVRVDVAGVGLP